MNARVSMLGKLNVLPHRQDVGPIGLHCTLSHVHLVQMGMDEQHRIALRAYASIPYREQRALTLASFKEMRALIHTALKAEPFKGRQVVPSLPATDTTVMSVNYKINPGQSDADAILGAMKERLSKPISNYVLDFLKVRSEQQGNERLAIVAVAEYETVIAYLETLRKCSLDVTRLEIGPVAINRLVSALCSRDSFENAVAINFGREASYITVVSGRRLLLDQEIPLGENKFLDDIATVLDVSHESAGELVSSCSFSPFDEMENKDRTQFDAELCHTLVEILKPRFLQLVEEISKTLIYVASQTRGELVKRIYLLGSLASWNGVAEYLNSLMQMNVESILNPLQPYDWEGITTNSASPEIAVATGLALSGLIHDE